MLVPSFTCYKLAPRGELPTSFEIARPLLIVYAPTSEAPDRGALFGLAKHVLANITRTIFVLSDVALEQSPDEHFGVEQIGLHLEESYDLLIFQQSDAPGALPVSLLNCLCRLDLRKIRFCDSSYGLSIYTRPPVNPEHRVLFLFPGVFAPPSLGSHQRALSFVLHMLESGRDVDITYTGGHKRAGDEALRYMRLLCPAPRYFLAKRQGDTPTLNRHLYRAACRVLGKKSDFPFSFEERAARFRPRRARAVVRRQLEETRYESVIVSYAWMMSILDGLDVGGAQVLCDTHDVQYFRNLPYRKTIPDIFFPRASEKMQEKRALRKCSRVLAISERDAALLRTELNLPNVHTVRLPYGLPVSEPRRRSINTPLRFGFIGSAMDANKKALDMVLKNWWPAISDFTPDSELSIAGAVTRSASLEEALFLREDVNVLGVVSSAFEFFSKIDILLSPVIIPGGLNIKNAEALLAGCVVFTNRLGASVLAPLRLPTVCDTVPELVKLLERLEQRDPALVAKLVDLGSQVDDLYAYPEIERAFAD